MKSCVAEKRAKRLVSVPQVFPNPPEISIPVHQHAGDGKRGKHQPQERPKNFDAKPPIGAEVHRREQPDEPVAQRPIVVYVPGPSFAPLLGSR
jgi:hypothetical protein